MMTRLHKGYTLTEILVVVTIIVVLGLAILVGINPIAQIFKGYDARRRADLDKIKIALEAYYSDHECYPIFPLTKQVNGEDRPSYACDSDILKPYLQSMPCDPNTKEPYTIYLTPPDSLCPQNYAVYAQIYSFFDKNTNNIEDCDDTIAVTSAGINYGDINYGCSSKTVCEIYYGCVYYDSEGRGTCEPLSRYEKPECTNDVTVFCSPVCGGATRCTKRYNACVFR